MLTVLTAINRINVATMRAWEVGGGNESTGNGGTEGVGEGIGEEVRAGGKELECVLWE